MWKFSTLAQAKQVTVPRSTPNDDVSKHDDEESRDGLPEMSSQSSKLRFASGRTPALRSKWSLIKKIIEIDSDVTAPNSENLTDNALPDPTTESTDISSVTTTDANKGSNSNHTMSTKQSDGKDLVNKPQNLSPTDNLSSNNRMSFAEKIELYVKQREELEKDDKRHATSNYDALELSRTKSTKLRGMVIPGSLFHCTWLGAISLCVLYNTVIIIGRVVFIQLQTDYLGVWIALDYITDCVYLMDMAIQLRTSYLEQGIYMNDWIQLAKRYAKSPGFRFDVVSILPTDFLYLAIGIRPEVRLNRILRWRRLTEFFERIIRTVSYPNILRSIKLFMYIVIITHWNGCFYFALSQFISNNYGNDSWVYPGNLVINNIDDADVIESLSQKYVYSFYWSTLTLLTIGETPHPEKDLEYAFVVLDFLIGVLIFATIVGNVGAMITNMNRDRSLFTQRMDAAKQYLKMRRCDPELERKVLSWFEYMWREQLPLNEEEVLNYLPTKLRAEVCMQIHKNTLRQVSMFKNCENGLLSELVLKLKFQVNFCNQYVLQVFSPGDYVCKKGDIGREMYIVKSGTLRVFDERKNFLATLTSGNVFGEISLLDIPGSKSGNRRIADVISDGFTESFVLEKNDLWAILQDYPETRARLVKRGKDILQLEKLLSEEDQFSVASHTSSLSSSDLAVEQKLKAMEAHILDKSAWMDKQVAYFSKENAILSEKVSEFEKRLKALTDSDTNNI